MGIHSHTHLARKTACTGQSVFIQYIYCNTLRGGRPLHSTCSRSYRGIGRLSIKGAQNTKTHTQNARFNHTHQYTHKTCTKTHTKTRNEHSQRQPIPQNGAHTNRHHAHNVAHTYTCYINAHTAKPTNTSKCESTLEKTHFNNMNKNRRRHPPKHIRKAITQTQKKYTPIRGNEHTQTQANTHNSKSLQYIYMHKRTHRCT